MSKIQIKHRYTDKILWEGGANSIKDALEKAVKDGANLEGAYLRGANLEGANLEGANLEGAKDVFGFTLGKHFGFFQPSSGHCRIGCEDHHIDHWLEHYETIGKEHSYPPESIRVYEAMLKMLKGFEDA